MYIKNQKYHHKGKLLGRAILFHHRLSNSYNPNEWGKIRVQTKAKHKKKTRKAATGYKKRKMVIATLPPGFPAEAHHGVPLPG